MNAKIPSNQRCIVRDRRHSILWLGLGIGLWTLSSTFAGERISGGPYTLMGGPVSGGGVVSGGGLTLDAAAGEVAPGTSRDGALELTGSLYSVVARAGGFTLTLRNLGNGTLELEWPVEAHGYVLETAAALGDPTRWQPVLPVPAVHRLTVPLEPGPRLYRLRQP